MSIQEYGFLLDWASFGQLADSLLIPNLKTRLYNDSLIIRNDSVIIENKTLEIERNKATIHDLNTEVKKANIKAGIWKATSGILGLITLRLIFKD